MLSSSALATNGLLPHVRIYAKYDCIQGTELVKFGNGQGANRQTADVGFTPGWVRPGHPG